MERNKNEMSLFRGLRGWGMIEPISTTLVGKQVHLLYLLVYNEHNFISRCS